MAGNRDDKHEADRILILVTLLLLAIGLLMVFSASYIIAEERVGDPYYFLKRQALWTVIGLGAMYLFSRINYRKLKQLSLLILLVNFVLLTLIFTGFGSDLGTEARRWLTIGPVVLQPSEFSKLAFVIFIAAYMSTKRMNLRNFWVSIVIPLALVGAAFLMIQFQPDMSTALVILVAAAMVVIFAGMPVSRMAGLSLLALPPLAYLTVREDYRLQRLFTFIDPWADPSESGYQIIQSLYALGSGHIFGAGLGRSKQKLFYLPEPQNDFIFAVIGEELGFIGAVAVLLLYLILIWRGFQIAYKAPDLFGSLLAAGIIFTFALQVVINVAVVTGMLPVTGINLPLVSYGGSSVLFVLCSIGILLNISKYTRDLPEMQRS
ncbi:MAG: rod shape-determining protein RodA [Firmicutes bacterium ML8_F2]|nr:MAG: rod shape-determining protein RodA [Firmicutes bacterium ML8_F2]